MNTMKRWIINGITILSLLAVSLAISSPAAAVSQPQVVISPSTAYIQAASAYTITFTSGAVVSAGDKIIVMFPPYGPELTGMAAAAPVSGDVTIQATTGIGGGPITPTINAVYEISGDLAQGYIVTVTVPDDGIGAGSLVQVVIGGVTGLTNPGAPGSYTLTVASQESNGTEIESAVISESYVINPPVITPLPGVVLGYNSAGILMIQSNSILAGMASVGINGRVEVGPGTYFGNNVVTTEGLTLTGTGSAGTVILDGNNSGTVLSIEADGVTVSGVTVQNSGNDGSGIAVGNVFNCLIQENLVINNNGSGIVVDTGSPGGSVVLDTAKNKITGNTVTGNTGSGVSILSDTPYVVNYNNITGNGAGITNLGGTTVDATNNWWGSVTGPYHTTNPDGEGDSVTDGVTFSPWANAETGIQYTLTISSSAHGTVTLPGEGTFTCNSGTVLTLLAEAETGSQFIEWIGQTGGISFTDSTLTTITMNGNYTISAVFEEVSISVDPLVGGIGDTITYSGQGFQPGHTVKLYFSSQSATAGQLLDTDVTLYELVANPVASGTGTISGTFTVPATLTTGSHTVTTGTYYVYALVSPPQPPSEVTLIVAGTTCFVSQTIDDYDQVVLLRDGWNLLSTDKFLDAASCSWGGNVQMVYRYTENGYLTATFADLTPVEVFLVYTDGGGYANLVYSTTIPPGASSKNLVTGWNLVSSASVKTADVFFSPLRYVIVGNQQFVELTTIVSQNNYNHTPGFYLATLTDANWNALNGVTIDPFKGYWVYVNYQKVFGVVLD